MTSLSRQDAHAEFVDPFRHDSFEVALQECQAVVVTGGEVADVERYSSERLDLSGVSLGEEPFGDPALIEDFDRSSVQSSRPWAFEVLVRSAFDHDDVDVGQGQLCGEHHPRRSTPDNNDLVLSSVRTGAISVHVGVCSLGRCEVWV